MNEPREDPGQVEAWTDDYASGFRFGVVLWPESGRFARPDGLLCSFEVARQGQVLLRLSGSRLSTALIAAGHALKERGL